MARPGSQANPGTWCTVSSSVNRSGRMVLDRQRLQVCTSHVESGRNQLCGSQNHTWAKIMRVYGSQKKEKKPVCWEKQESTADTEREAGMADDATMWELGLHLTFLFQSHPRVSWLCWPLHVSAPRECLLFKIPPFLFAFFKIGI